MTSTTIQNVTLLGPGGTTGAPILQALTSSNFNVSVAVRPSSSFETTDPKIKRTHIVDYTSLNSLIEAFHNQDAVVSAVTTFAVPTQPLIIDAALKAGVKHFIPSEYGMDTCNPAAERYIPATKMKRDVVSYLRENESRMSWSAICVGAYFDWSLLNGYGGYDFAKGIVQIHGDEHFEYEATNMGRIGEVIVKCLERVDKVKNTYVYVHSFKVSQKQVLESIQKADGNRIWEVERVSLEDLYDGGRKEASATELNQGVAMMIRSMLMGYHRQNHLNDFGDKAIEWMQTLGLHDEDLEKSCQDIIAQRTV